MTTTYYDPMWRKPVITLDNNNNPGRKINYDQFGRPIEWRRIDKSDPATEQLLVEKEYHLMGE